MSIQRRSVRAHGKVFTTEVVVIEMTLSEARVAVKALAELRTANLTELDPAEKVTAENLEAYIKEEMQ